MKNIHFFLGLFLLLGASALAETPEQALVQKIQVVKTNVLKKLDGWIATGKVNLDQEEYSRLKTLTDDSNPHHIQISSEPHVYLIESQDGKVKDSKVYAYNQADASPDPKVVFGSEWVTPLLKDTLAIETLVLHELLGASKIKDYDFSKSYGIESDRQELWKKYRDLYVKKLLRMKDGFDDLFAVNLSNINTFSKTVQKDPVYNVCMNTPKDDLMAQVEACFPLLTRYMEAIGKYMIEYFTEPSDPFDAMVDRFIADHDTAERKDFLLTNLNENQFEKKKKVANFMSEFIQASLNLPLANCPLWEKRMNEHSWLNVDVNSLSDEEVAVIKNWNEKWNQPNMDQILETQRNEMADWNKTFTRDSIHAKLDELCPKEKEHGMKDLVRCFYEQTSMSEKLIPSGAKFQKDLDAKMDAWIKAAQSMNVAPL